MSSGLTNEVPKKGDVFRHQNGIDYHIEGLARVDNDYQELLVVATGPDGVMWARPIGNFMGLRGGAPRFEKVDKSPADSEATKPFAVVGGVTYLLQAEFDKAFLELTSLQVDNTPAGLTCTVMRTARLAKAVAAEDDSYHWNKPEDLPPVGCTLLIKVPAGNKVVREGRADPSTTEDLIFNVFRVSHLADRAGDMEYRLPDNSTVTGRFPWTYP